MKTIELKVTKEKANEQDYIISTVQIMRDIINSKPEKGYTIEEMMQRLKVLEIVDKHKKEFSVNGAQKIEDVPHEFFDKKITIDIEDADYEALKEWVKNMRWGIVSKFIIDFVQSFK